MARMNADLEAKFLGRDGDCVCSTEWFARSRSLTSLGFPSMSRRFPRAPFRVAA